MTAASRAAVGTPALASRSAIAMPLQVCSLHQPPVQSRTASYVRDGSAASSSKESESGADTAPRIDRRQVEVSSRGTSSNSQIVTGKAFPENEPACFEPVERRA